MRQSRLPVGGTNLFQAIKAKCAAAEAAGQRLYKLSIGQPTGPALLPARQRAATHIASDDQAMHEYQDNVVLLCPDFARRFVRCHVRTGLAGGIPPGSVDYLPIPGIKPMLGLIPLACGAAERRCEVLTTTKPGYPTPVVWCQYLGVEWRELSLDPDNEFRFDPDELLFGSPNLVMMNYPHNPTGQIMTREWLKRVCQICSDRGIRLFNDAAYAILDHSGDHWSLADVAVDYPDLSWAEAYSASKAGNFTGWRVGAMIGSPDFIGDIRTIKGNTDSGLNAALALGALELFENYVGLIYDVRETYGRRLSLLIKALAGAGMKLAVHPQAGFFSLWLTPKRAFGQDITSAEQFNFLMIEKTGIVGVHFDPYIRYAVCGPVEEMIEDIGRAFDQAKVEY